MVELTKQRRALLTAALGFRAIEWRYRPNPAGALAKYLDSWRGLGDVIVGMHAQGFDVELRQLGDHWRSNFYANGMYIPSSTVPPGSRRRGERSPRRRGRR